jgi:AmmeMemoRadiSam system protein A
MQFTAEQQRGLLAYARRVLVGIVNDGKKIEEKPADENFLEKAGVFVSLHKDKELRGCIGFIEPIASIWEAITENTISSATNDFRFPPVTSDELDDLKIEISILTPPIQCQREEIEPNKNGVIIQSGIHKATYLPQVWEVLPEPEQFYSSLCQKAGLEQNCWRGKSIKFLKYEAIVFHE